MKFLCLFKETFQKTLPIIIELELVLHFDILEIAHVNEFNDIKLSIL